MSTATTERSASGEDRFARRQRSWTGVPGVPARPPSAITADDALAEREARRTPTGEYLSTKLNGTFFPHALFQTTVVVFIVFFVLLAITFFFPPTVGAPADPLNKALYLPRPAWYFYFLFTILEWFKGQFLVPIAAFWLPNIAIIALILLPFYDRTKTRKPWKRPVAVTIFGLCMAFIVVSTVWQLVVAPAQPTSDDQNHAPTQSAQQ